MSGLNWRINSTSYSVKARYLEIISFDFYDYNVAEDVLNRSNGTIFTSKCTFLVILYLDNTYLNVRLIPSTKHPLIGINFLLNAE